MFALVDEMTSLDIYIATNLFKLRIYLTVFYTRLGFLIYNGYTQLTNV